MDSEFDPGNDPGSESFVRSLMWGQSLEHGARSSTGNVAVADPIAPSDVVPVVVLLAFDPAMVAEAEVLLHRDGYAVRIVPDAARAASAVDADAPSCVVVWRDCADEQLVGCIADLRGAGCDRPLIVVCKRAEAEAAVTMMSRHGAAFIIGPDALDRLREQVGTALANDRDARRRAALVGAARDGVRKLTPRELEVLTLMLRGMCNKDIATSMGLSVKTVETHRSRVLHKLGVLNIAEFAHVLLTLLT